MRSTTTTTIMIFDWLQFTDISAIRIFTRCYYVCSEWDKRSVRAAYRGSSMQSVSDRWGTKHRMQVEMSGAFRWEEDGDGAVQRLSRRLCVSDWWCCIISDVSRARYDVRMSGQIGHGIVALPGVMLLLLLTSIAQRQQCRLRCGGWAMLSLIDETVHIGSSLVL